MMSLHAEVIASVLAAGLLGLGCGWMISRVRGERRLRGTLSVWEAKHAKLERQSQADIETLEARLESLGGEMRALVSRDRDADERLARSESSMHKARTDLIELNRQQAETQEHLQHLLRQRDRTIAALEAGAMQARGGLAAPRPEASRSAPPRTDAPARPVARNASPPRAIPSPTPPPGRAAQPARPPAAAPASVPAPPALVRSIPMRPLPPAGQEPGAGIAATRAAAARVAANAANRRGASHRPDPIEDAADPADDSFDATELADGLGIASLRADDIDDIDDLDGIDDVDVTYAVDSADVADAADAADDEFVDETVVATRGGDTVAYLDDTVVEPIGMRDAFDEAADPLDTTGDSTVVLDEAQLRAVRRIGQQ